MNANKLHRVFRHLTPRTKARLIKDGYVPRRGGANKLTLEDLYYIDELNGKSDAPPPKPEPVVPVVPVVEPKEEEMPKELLDKTMRAMNEWLLSQAPPPSAQVIPFKKKP